MKQKINILWLIPIVLISGIFGFLTNSFSFFVFKNEIDIINLLTLIITSALGWYLAYNLPKNIDANKFEKELIYDIIKPLNNKIKSLLNDLKSNNLNFKQTVKTFKEISTLISDFEELNDICLIIEECDMINLIRNDYNNIKHLITNSSVKNESFLLN